jgi:Carboxypeptidase regulatory-like domain
VRGKTLLLSLPAVFVIVSGLWTWLSAQNNSGSPARYRIAGIVVSKSDGHSLARAQVVIRNTKHNEQVFSTTTAENGSFEFAGLGLGKYSLLGEKRGYLQGSYDQHEQFSTAIVTGAGLDTENLVLRLSPASYIAGRVLDEVGEPVRRANLTLYELTHDEGVSRIATVRTGASNDLGAFELGPQAPGTYYVVVQAAPWYAIHRVRGEPGAGNSKSATSTPGQVDPSLDVVYPLTYYSDVTDPDSATPISLRGGEHTQIEIHLSPVPALHLYFHVQEGQRNGNWFPQLMQSGFDQDLGVPMGAVQSVAPGLWEMTGIPPGKYSVRLFHSGKETDIKQVYLDSNGQEVDTSGGEELTDIKVLVHLVGGGSLPSRLMVGLRREHGGFRAGQLTDSKGEAHLQQVSPGEYEVLVWARGTRYSIVQITSNDVPVSGHLLSVPAGANLSISVALLTGLGNVQGFVKKEGKPVAGSMVVLVPRDPASNPDLFRRDQSDLDGSFQLHSVVPGSYTILAIENGWDLDWSQPAAIAPYMQKGQPVEIVDRHSISLSQPVEIQTK